MKVERIVNVYKDNGDKIEIGDYVSVETESNIYNGTVKNIKQGVIGVKIGANSYAIRYSDIISIK